MLARVRGRANLCLRLEAVVRRLLLRVPLGAGFELQPAGHAGRRQARHGKQGRGDLRSTMELTTKQRLLSAGLQAQETQKSHAEG